MARETGLEPATSTVTGWHSNQLSYSPAPYLYQPLTSLCIAVNSYIKYTLFRKMQAFFSKKMKKNEKNTIGCPEFSEKLLKSCENRRNFSEKIFSHLDIFGGKWYIQNGFTTYMEDK